MPIALTNVPRPDWSPLPHPDCHDVDGKVLLRLPHLTLAMLRFQPGGTIHEHAANHEIDVIVLEGSGMTSIGDEATAVEAGQTVRWPAGRPHRLWTSSDASEPMITLMVEHLARKSE